MHLHKETTNIMVNGKKDNQIKGIKIIPIKVAPTYKGNIYNQQPATIVGMPNSSIGLRGAPQKKNVMGRIK